MNGIVFFGTEHLEDIVAFHTGRLGAVVWLEQPACTILRHGNLIVGFCRAQRAQTDGLITLVVDHRSEVDEVYERLEDVASSQPRYNAEYAIYHFYGTDPEGRPFEVQCFDEAPPLRG